MKSGGEVFNFLNGKQNTITKHISNSFSFNNKDQNPLLEVEYEKIELGVYDFASALTISATKLTKEHEQLCNTGFKFILGIAYIECKVKRYVTIIFGGMPYINTGGMEHNDYCNVIPNLEDEGLEEIYNKLHKYVKDAKEQALASNKGLEATYLELDYINKINGDAFPSFEINLVDGYDRIPVIEQVFKPEYNNVKAALLDGLKF